jgi:hypothetical protein
LPFTGASRTSTGYNALFGYIFGEEKYTDYTTTASETAIRRTISETHDETHGVETVEDLYTFYIPFKLVQINLTDEVTEIKDYALSGLTNVTEINLPNFITSIGTHAFDGDIGLYMIDIPTSVKNIGSQAFINMNDDFFINQPTSEIKPATAGTLQDHIERIERNHRNRPTAYTIELRRAQRVLEEAGLPTNSYELHIPMIVNRKKLAETLVAFPPRHATRSLYGNLHRIGGARQIDCKVIKPDQKFKRDAQFLSSDDSTWGDTELANFIRERFPDKSRWEE